MIDEVVAAEAELELLAFRSAHGEILEHRHVGVEESRPGQGRPDIVALHARRNKGREACSINILIGLEPASRIASQRGHQRDIRSAKDVLTVPLYGGTGRLTHKCRARWDEAGVVKVGRDGGL